ncbi:acyltransferase family protein [Luteibacter sp. SG786]|uniref:acyltransferase family protein n=1 Tax=Luteibacter sp. SG786 TaxID=2587130 RepID=UPI001422BB68|nr:acyltransferase family protein [Luteibacter sp. SG786]NII56395.1 peptidoglycan/LPS O-acetylase OafA/YrhL [Luteibacter sp. SG786]
MTMNIPRARYLPHIDALRALAVLAVVAYHLDGRLLPGGFAGVDVFFVISGFVVSMAASSRGPSSSRAFVVDFFARRVRRIVPALGVCLLVTAFMSALWIPPSWLSDNVPRTGRYAFFGLGNIVLARSDNQYFSPLAEFNPFTHTWSLGVEEQFYLVFPFLFAMWLRGGRCRVVALALFMGGAAMSFLLAVDMIGAGNSKGYYLFIARFWEMAAGVLLYLGWSSTLYKSISARRDYRRIRTLLLAVGAACLCWSLLCSEPGKSPGYATLVPVAAAALLIAAFDAGRVVEVRRARNWHSWLTSVGQMSYSLYLWHWPVIVLFKWTVGFSKPWQSATALALSFLLARLSWRFVERPFRSEHVFANVTPGRTVVVAFMAICIGSGIAHAMDRHQAKFSFSTVARSPELWYPSKGQRLTDEKGCKVSPSRTDLAVGWRVTYRRNGCQGNSTAPDVFAVGDSHALAYGPAFASYALQTGAVVTVYNNGGCPFLSLQPWREDNPRCRESSSNALTDLLPNLQPGSVVFLPSLRLPRFVDQWVIYPGEQVNSLAAAPRTSEHAESTMRDARAVLAKLRATGASVMLQAPGPVLKAPPFRCADWWTASNEICAAGTRIDRSEFLALRDPMLAALESLAGDDHGIGIFDPVKSLCPGGQTCEGLIDGKPLFFDGDHISAYGNQVLLPSFTASMRQAVVPSNGAPSLSPPLPMLARPVEFDQPDG